MKERKTSPILKIKWENIEQPETAELRHVLIEKQEFYAIAYHGNLLLTPEEIEKAHQRFISYPNIERTWPIWELSAEDIENIAEQFDLDIKGLDIDEIARRFKDAFNEGTLSWDETLRDCIKEVVAESQIHA